MKRLLVVAMFGLVAAVALFAAEKSAPKAGPEWAMNATIIEACSCPMFCQCYFNSSPAGHAGHEGHEGHGGGEHFCKFNNAFKVNKGSYKGVKLDGVKFWAAGDLGGDFSKGQMDWAVVTFDKKMSKEQRDAVAAIVAHLYPVKWNSLTTAEGDITWQAGNGQARAAIDGGRTAEVVLKAASQTNNPAKPIVIKNLKYWGAPTNDGFIMMPNEVQAYRVGDKAYEFKGTNGFMITFDINSLNAPPAAGT